MNIAIITGSISSVAVVDLDSEESVEYAKTQGYFCTPTVITSKGFHLYFKHENGLRNFKNTPLLPKIDFRGEAGYVVAPPSIHPTGVKYKWVEDAHIGKTDICNLPKKIQNVAMNRNKGSYSCANTPLIQRNTHNSAFNQYPIICVAEKLGIKFMSKSKALCFRGHDVKTPSLSFNPQKNYFHCFGCGVGGGPISLVMNYLNFNYKEAISWLLTNKI